MCDLTTCDENRSGERVAATGKQPEIAGGSVELRRPVAQDVPRSGGQESSQKAQAVASSYAGRLRRTCQEVVDRMDGAADNRSKVALGPLTAAPLSMLSARPRRTIWQAKRTSARNM